MAEVRPIDANQLIEALENLRGQYIAEGEYVSAVIAHGFADLLRKESTALTLDYEPVVHARWEWYEEPVTFICPDPDYGWRCSHCKEDAAEMIQRTFPISNVEFDDDEIPPDFDRCPNCGAKMDGGEGNA